MASWLQRAMTRRVDGVFDGNEPAEDRLAAKEAIIPLRCFHASRVGSYVDVQFICAAPGQTLLQTGTRFPGTDPTFPSLIQFLRQRSIVNITL